MDINAAAKEYGNGVITSLKKNRRILKIGRAHV